MREDLLHVKVSELIAEWKGLDAAKQTAATPALVDAIVRLKQDTLMPAVATAAAHDEPAETELRTMPDDGEPSVIVGMATGTDEAWPDGEAMPARPASPIAERLVGGGV